MNDFIYLDHNATTPLLPEARDALVEALSAFGNPSSPHQAGRTARTLLEDARKRIARRLEVSPQEVLFTSGGSESNNTVLQQVVLDSGARHLITSAVEHPSVLEPARALNQLPEVSATQLPVNEQGQVHPDALADQLRPETRLVSVMAANNETGARQPLAALSALCRSQGIGFHSDVTQALGKLPLDWNLLDYATAASHKLGGPKGIGLLYVRKQTPLHPLIWGGKQERVRRAGTESVALACGFATALEWFLDHQDALQQQFQEARQRVLPLVEALPGYFRNSPQDADCLPHTLNFGITGLSAETLLISLDLDGIGVSTGSACSSGALEASPVLLAQGRSREQARASLRVSWGWNTPPEALETFGQRLAHHVHRLLKKKPCRSAG